MPDTFTPNILLDDQTIGGNNNSWGNILNGNQNIIDAKFGALTALATTGGTTTLTQNQELVGIIALTGALVSNAIINFSGRGGFWIVYNNTSGALTVTCKVTGQTGVVVPQGAQALIYCNGTDIFFGNPPAAAAAEVAIASASTTDISSLSSEYVSISGTANITSLGSTPTVKRFCRATGAFTITPNGSTLQAPGNAPITAQAGDTFLVIFDASGNARIFFYTRVAYIPPVPPPVGAVMDYAGTSAPALWQLCYGQAVSRTTFAALFAVLGITWGAGDGITTFNLPDLRGRVVAGKDNMGGVAANRLNISTDSLGVDGATLGAVGGEQMHTLTQAELPAAVPSGTISITDNGHTHTIPFTGAVTAAGPSSFNGNLSRYTNSSNTTTSSSTTGISASFTGNALGSGNAHNVVQPTMILNKIIFAGV